MNTDLLATVPELTKALLYRDLVHAAVGLGVVAVVVAVIAIKVWWEERY